MKVHKYDPRYEWVELANEDGAVVPYVKNGSVHDAPSIDLRVLLVGTRAGEIIPCQGATIFQSGNKDFPDHLYLEKPEGEFHDRGPVASVFARDFEYIIFDREGAK